VPLSTTPSEEEAEPAPEMHPHPEVPPDDLSPSARASDAKAATVSDAAVAACPYPSSPPVPPPLQAVHILSGPPVTNRIPPEVVMRPVRARAGCVRRCYDDALARSATLTGSVSVRFVVDPDGWVRTARVERDGTGDAAFAACVAKQFTGLEYPQPEGGRITVIFPMTFAP
jgi:TonB family protein